MGPGHWLALAWLLGGVGLGAFIVYAVVAAWARDWKVFWAAVTVVATIVVTSFVALHFNT